MLDLIYLASPYSDPDPEVRQRRYEAAMKVTARLLREGQVVFSPIVYGHVMALRHDLPSEWDFWWMIDEVMLAKCDRLLVLKLDGWNTSKGVRAEINMAEERGMQVEFIEAV